MTICQKYILPFLIGALAILQACGGYKNYYTIPATGSEGTFNAVIEIPAGTNTKYEYDPTQKKFIIDMENGKARVIDFLPYPANYGFIPSTLSKSETGGDGDALDVLVISESEPIGAVVQIIPIAILKLVDDGEMDSKIIATPKEKEKQVVHAKTFNQLERDYPKLLEIIGLWFLNYNPTDASTIKGWGNEVEALNEIKLHLKD